MKGILRWSLAAFAFLALLAITAAGFLISLDADSLKNQLAARASDLVGRPLAVDGALAIKLGRTVQLTAEGLHLANAEWGSRPDMLRAARVRVEFDAWSLIDRPVIVHRIEIDGFDLLLERTAQGEHNWDFGGADEDQVWLAELPVIIDEIAMPGARISFIGPRLDRPLELRLDALDQRRGADGFLALSASGQANDVGISLRARAGPFDNLVAGRDFEVSLDGELGEVRVTGRAQVDDLENPADTDLNLRVQAPDADYLAARLGVRNLGSGPVALSAVIAPAAAGQGVRGAVSGQVGAFEIEARGELADPAAMEKIAVRLEVAGPDLTVLGGLAGVNRLPPEKFRLRADIERSGQLLKIGQFDLDLQDSAFRLQGSVDRDLGGTDVEFRFKGSDVARFRRLLNLPGAASGPFELAGRAGRSDIGSTTLEAKATTSLGQVSVSGPLGPYPDYYGSRLRFNASGPDLAQIGTALGVPNLPATAFTSRGQFVWARRGITFSDSMLSVGPDRLTLDGRIGRRPLGPDTDVRFVATGRDLRRVARVLGVEGAPAAAYDLRGRLRREKNASGLNDLRGTIAGASLRLSGRIADRPVQGGTNVNFEVSGPALEAFAGLVPDFALPAGRFRAAGGLELTPVKAEFRKLRVEAAGAAARLDADVQLPLGNATGTFDIDARGPDLGRFLPTLGKARPLSKSFDLAARGVARNGRWSFERMQLRTGAGQLSLTGDLDWSPDFSATDLRLDVDLPDLAVAGQIIGLQLPAQPLKLTADFSGTPTAFRMQQLSGRLGPSDFSGRFGLVLSDPPELDVEIQSQLLDLPSLKGAGPAAPAPAPPVGRRLIPDTPLPLDWLTRVNGAFDVTAKRAHIADSAFENVRLVARLRDGNLIVDPLELRGLGGGQFVIRGEVLPSPGGAAMKLNATSRQMVLSPWADTPAQAATRPRADLDLQLEAEGRTWRQLAASLDGRLRLVSGAGETPTAGLERLLGNLWRTLVKSVRGQEATRSMKLRCAALVANIADGLAVTAPVLAFQTEQVNVIAHGALNLRDEKIEFYLNTTPRKRLGISAGEIINPYVKIAGPLSAPALAVDAKGTLFSAGTAFATAGLSIVAKSLWDRMFRAEDPCAAALAEADQLAKQPPKKRADWRPRFLK